MVTSITATMYVRFDTVSLTVDDSIVASDISKHADIELKENEVWLPINDPNVIAYYEQQELAKKALRKSELESLVASGEATIEQLQELLLIRLGEQNV